MNNYFNFEIPFFNSQFGQDWDSFNTIVESNNDYLFNKTYDLYKLRDINRMPILALDIALDLRNIETDATEALNIKKQKLRWFNKDFKSKSMKDTYLDYQETVVGTRGEIYNGYVFGTSVWGLSSWSISGAPEDTDRIWSSTDTKFDIYINTKTTDSGLLDELVEIYRESYLKPAFYNLFLIDDDFNILRTV